MRMIAIPNWTLPGAAAVFSLLIALSSLTLVPALAQGNDCEVSIGVTQEGNTITGTGGNDTIDCTNSTSPKIITGGEGDDTITGGLGNDYIDGGGGNDTITGGPAHDCIWGRAGNDTLTGSEGSNTIYAGEGENTVSNNTDPEGAITGCNEDGTTTTPSTVEPGVPSADATTQPDSGITVVAVTVTSASVSGGDSTTATVTLSAPASSGGATVLLESDNPSAGVATSVFVQEGETTAVFEIGTSSVTETTYTTISASLNESVVSAELEIVPQAAQSALPGEDGATNTVTTQSGSNADSGGNTTGNVTSLPSTGNGVVEGAGGSTVLILIAAVSLAGITFIKLWNKRRTNP